MMQRSTAILLPLAGVLALSGCLDVRQDVWVNPDGTGRLRIDMGLIDNLSEIGDSEGDSASPGMVEDIKRIQRRIKDDERIRSIRVEEYSSDGYDRAALDIVVYDWADLPAVNELVLEELNGSDSGLSDYLRFTLREEPDGKVYYRQPPGSGLEPPTPMPTEDEKDLADVVGRTMAHALFQDGSLTVTLHSPTISRTNGNWQLDKSSVRWSVRMAELLTDGPDGGFVAEVGPAARGSHFWRVVGIIVTVSLLVWFLAWFRRGRGENGEVEPVR